MTKIEVYKIVLVNLIYRFYMKLLLIILFLCINSVTFSQENNGKIKKNVEILKDIISDITCEILNEIKINPQNPKIICSGNDNNWIIESLFNEAFRNNESAKKYPVDSGTLIEINQNNKLYYSKTRADEEKIIRGFNIFIMVKTRITGNIFSKSINRTFKDTISLGDIEKVEHNRIMVSMDNSFSDSVFDVLLKPVVVVVSFGLLVYSFFSIRSN
jgi:hypothetical protein